MPHRHNFCTCLHMPSVVPQGVSLKNRPAATHMSNGAAKFTFDTLKLQAYQFQLINFSIRGLRRLTGGFKSDATALELRCPQNSSRAGLRTGIPFQTLAAVPALHSSPPLNSGTLAAGYHCPGRCDPHFVAGGYLPCQAAQNSGG